MTILPFQSRSKDLKNTILSIEEDGFFLLTDDSIQAKDIAWQQHAQERLQQVGLNTQAGMIYADYHQHPLIDYQVGSLRDDFDFGKIVWINTAAAKMVLNEMPDQLGFAAFYALRLALSRRYPILHLRECLYRLLPQENIDKEAR
ncbi:MAG: hypothetical protein II277_03115, partial [Bacteroidales bacterium]|nr:hypothetical protein [Bacteroidales bacterium]